MISKFSINYGNGRIIYEVKRVKKNTTITSPPNAIKQFQKHKPIEMM